MAGVETLKKYLGKEVMGKNGQKVSNETLIGPGKIIGLFFSAHWCLPGRNFTPVLIEFYKECKRRNPNFEIVFFSRDRDEHSFHDYYQCMPWLAVPFSNQDHIQMTMRELNVCGIPTFVLLNGLNGKVIHANAKDHVEKDTEGQDFPWRQ